MNKLKSDISSKLNKQVSKTTTLVNSKSSGNEAGLLAPLDTRSTSLKNVQTVSVANLKNQKEMGTSTFQQQIKKKRTALENISNASISSNGLNANSNNNSTNNNGSLVNKEITKKSRFGGLNPVFGNNVTNHQPLAKKTESVPLKKKELMNSKENLATLNPPVIAKKQQQTLTQKQQTISNTKQQTEINVQLASVSVSTTATSITASFKIDVKEEKCMSENVIQDMKIENCETQIERQLASTTLSTSSLSDLLPSSSLSQLKLESSENLNSIIETDKVATSEPVEDWEDIDANEEADEFNASDYVAYIFKYYREREEKFRVDDYIKRQPHITKHMRLLLVDWMVEVQQQLEFNHEVLYLSIKLLDLYLNSKRIEKERLQLLGGAAMLIACKFEERMPPIIDDFIFVSDNAYDRKDLIKMEIEILKTVKFDIGIPLSYTFLRRYSKCIKADMKFLTLARYILELSLQEYSFASVIDSLKACAALYLALKMTVKYEKATKLAFIKSNEQEISKGNPIKSTQPTFIVSSANLTSTEWNSTLIHYTGAQLKDFIMHVPAMNKLVQTAPSFKYKTIFKKYSHHVFYEVAKLSPMSDIEIDALIRGCQQTPTTNKLTSN